MSVCVHECVSAALTVKLNWGSGEKQSNASLLKERETERERGRKKSGGEELNTPRNLQTM